MTWTSKVLINIQHVRPFTEIVSCPCTHTLGFLISKMGDHMVPTIRSSKLMNQYAHKKKTKYIQKMIKLSLAHMDIHMISNITLIQSNFKWRTCLLPSDFIKIINIMVNLKSSKATCNTQSNSTCFSKTTKWKNARWLWKKKRTWKE
jgi:hypothetical protein